MIKIMEKVIELSPKYTWLQGMKCKQLYEYVTFEILD